MNRPVMVYLAGPIDDVEDTESRGWRESMILSAPAGVVFYSPAHAYINVNEANFTKVDRANRVAISHCVDGMLVNLAGEGRGFGTIREIEFARMNNIPVAVAGEVASMMRDDLFIASDLGTALTLLLEAIQEERNIPQHPLFRMFGIGGPDEAS